MLVLKGIQLGDDDDDGWIIIITTLSISMRFPLLPKEEVEISGKGLSDYDDNGALCG